MIYLFTAMFCEAQALIGHFHLKKDTAHTRFQFFSNEDAGVCLTITGTGSVAAAAAVAAVLTEYGAGQGDFLLNVGSCADVTGVELTGEKGDGLRTGGIFLCNKLTEETTGRTFYPDILYRHRFAEAQLITAARPFLTEGREPQQNGSGGILLCDMEAASVYQAGAYFFGPHQMSFLKIVSDRGNLKDVTSEEISRRIAAYIADIAGYVKTLIAVSKEEKREKEMWGVFGEAETEGLLRDMHCSRTMAEALLQHIRYCVLAGIDYRSAAEAMYREEWLPCRDKKEGKLCFEEFKRRIL